MLTACRAWNACVIAIILIDSDRLRATPSGLMNLRDAPMTDWSLLVAGLVMSAAPIIVMFVVARRCFLSGFAAGVVQG